MLLDKTNFNKISTPLKTFTHICLEETENISTILNHNEPERSKNDFANSESFTSMMNPGVPPCTTYLKYTTQ